MKPAKSISATTSSGASRPLILAAIFFILGAGLTGAWFHYHESSRNADELSEPVRNALEHLAVPVTIRFYSLLPAGSASAEEQAFSGRVEDLLAAMQADSAGKIQVTRVFSASPLPAAKIGKPSPGSSRNGNRRWNTIWFAPLRAWPPSPSRPNV